MKALRIASGVLLLLVGPIGIALGVLDELAARVGCDCTAADVGSDWAPYGTATSAPLAPLVALAVGFGLSFTGGWRQTVGIAVLALVGGLVIVGSIGEPFVPSEADTPHFLLAIFRALSYVAAASVLVLGVRELVTRYRARGEGGR